MANPTNKRVLLVDDDPVIVRIYRDGLTRRGFEVTSATDGLAALQALRSGNQDIVVLDLMMPKLSGVEVLKFMRSQKESAKLPVIVLSNAYMDPLANDAAKLDVQKALLKVKCNVASLATAINEVLEGATVTADSNELLAAAADSTMSRPNSPGTSAQTTHERESEERSSISARALDTTDPARHELAHLAQRLIHNLQEALDALPHARDSIDRKLRLENLYRKVHFITGMASLAEYNGLAQMASAFEAMLFGMMDKLPELEPSLERTTSTAVEFLQELLRRPAESSTNSAHIPSALVVDDDRLSNRLVVTALRNAHLQARGTESPELALQWLREKTYDLVLLDVEMPGTNGIELCRKLRALPGYEKTPVIYVTFHSDFGTRAQTVLTGGTDLISKPVLPSELAVKAVMHLLKSRLRA